MLDMFSNLTMSHMAEIAWTFVASRMSQMHVCPAYMSYLCRIGNALSIYVTLAHFVRGSFIIMDPVPLNNLNCRFTS